MNQSSIGFTVVEVLTIIVVASTLLGITWGVSDSYLEYSRDNERDVDVKTTARTFENYYRTQASANGLPTYPTVDTINDATQRSTIIPSDDDRLYAPLQSVVSLSAASTTTVPNPSLSQYVYQPFTATDTVCLSAGNTPCVRFSLYYRNERSNTVLSVESMHQQ